MLVCTTVVSCQYFIINNGLFHLIAWNEGKRQKCLMAVSMSLVKRKELNLEYKLEQSVKKLR